MASHVLNGHDHLMLDRVFTLAEGFGGGARRAQNLLCAWYNAEELGGFDFADLWSFDNEHLGAVVAVILLIGRLPQGTYPNDIEGFDARMRAVAARRGRERHAQPDPDV